jgi:ATP-dependent DNA helicase RecQ
VSPLLALMRNQIEAAERAGIRATTINPANVLDLEEVAKHMRVAAPTTLRTSRLPATRSEK